VVAAYTVAVKRGGALVVMTWIEKWTDKREKSMVIAQMFGRVAPARDVRGGCSQQVQLPAKVRADYDCSPVEQLLCEARRRPPNAKTGARQRAVDDLVWKRWGDFELHGQARVAASQARS